MTHIAAFRFIVYWWGDREEQWNNLQILFHFSMNLFLSIDKFDIFRRQLENINDLLSFFPMYTSIVFARQYKTIQNLPVLFIIALNYFFTKCKTVHCFMMENSSGSQLSSIWSYRLGEIQTLVFLITLYSYVSGRLIDVHNLTKLFQCMW